jgi:hypothetical protein
VKKERDFIKMPHVDMSFNIRQRTAYFKLNSKKKAAENIKKKLKDFNLFLGSFDLTFRRIEIVERENKETNNFNMEIKPKHLATDETFITQMAKDAANMSEKGYINFRKEANKIQGMRLPPLNRLNTFKKKMNQFFKVHKNQYGAYVSPKDKIEFVLNKIYQNLKKTIVNDTFFLEFCGDGTLLTKTRLNILNFTFNVLNVKDLSFRGHYTLGEQKF